MSDPTMVHTLVDLETLGTQGDAVVLDVAVIVYDLEKDKDVPIPDLLDAKSATFKLNVSEQVEKYGRLIDSGTVDWWMNQSLDAQQKVLPSADDLSLDAMRQKLVAFLDDMGYNPDKGFVWQRGNLDVVWLDSIWRNLELDGKDYPLKWYKARDIRTAVDLAGISSKLNGYADNVWSLVKKEIPGFTKHNSLHDLGMDVLNLRLARVF